MAKINQSPPSPLWPWGGPRSVRERLVDPSQLDRKRASNRKGDPKNPALASAALLDFIGPAHSSDELRLPMPPLPAGHDADLEGFSDRAQLSTVAERGNPQNSRDMEQGLGQIRVAPDRLERLKVLLGREAQMVGLVSRIRDEIVEIQRRMREEQNSQGY